MGYLRVGFLSESEKAPAPTVRSHTRRSSYTTVTYLEGVGQAHAGSLVGCSVPMGPYGTRLVDSVGFLVVSLTALAPIILPSSLLQDSPSSV